MLQLVWLVGGWWALALWAGAGAGAQPQVQYHALTPSSAPPSPCPDVFQYTRGRDGVWRGQLRARAPPRGQPIRLRLDLFLEAALPNKYAGRIFLMDDKDLVAQKIIAGSRDQIRYIVLFPLLFPLPQIDRILVNEDVMCLGPRVSSSLLTKISLEHTLYPTVSPLDSGNNNIPQGNQQGVYPWQNASGLQPQLQPQQPPPPPPQPQPLPQPQSPQQPPFQQQPSQPEPRPPSEDLPFRPKPKPIVPTDPKPQPPYRETAQKPQQIEQTSAEICGRSVAPNELILHGRDTARGEWPWITAIFISLNIGNLEFQCSGTLFNRKHVITAGHCVKPRDQPEVEPYQLVIYLGMFNLRRVADAYNQPREVEQIFVHPDFGLTTSFDADMAVLRLSVPAVYTPYVRPICLWTGSQKLEAVVGMRGIVIGWGRDEKGNKATNEPRQTELPIVSQEECLLSQSDFITITSKRTFCAGFRNDTGPCNGDSGSGMFLRFSDGTVPRWYLRGITSVSLYDRQQNRCDLRNYVVFTDMAKYGSWMQQFAKDDSL